jgi:hypothetical protein
VGGDPASICAAEGSSALRGEGVAGEPTERTGMLWPRDRDGGVRSERDFFRKSSMGTVDCD